MNRKRKLFMAGAVAALGFCCLGTPAHAQQTETQSQSFEIGALGGGDTLTFNKFDGTVPCRVLQEVRLGCDWIVNGDFQFTNDADFDCSGTGELVHNETLLFPGAGGGIQCQSSGTEPVTIGPLLPPGQTQFFPDIIDLAYTDMVSFTMGLDQFVGAPGETVDAVLTSLLGVLLQVPCDNTNSTDTIWNGTITLEYIFVVPEAPVCTVTGDDRVCEGGSATLTVTATGGTGPYTYLWSTGEMTETITVSMTDTYCCTVTDALGCVSDPCCFDFAINPNPTCEITGDERVCDGDSGTLTVTATGGTGPYTYLWSTGETTQSIAVSVTDTYCCVVTDANGCESDPCCFDFSVNPNPTCVIIGPDRVCEGDSGILTVQGMGGTGKYTYLWSTGETTQSISVSVADTYCCVVIDSSGCESDPCCSDFSVNPNPTCEVTGPDRVCEGDSGMLTVEGLGGTGPYTYLWSTGETTQTIAVSVADTYCCVVTDANGCESEPCCFDFSVNPNPTCVITGDDRVCEGGSGMLTVNGMGGTPPYTYLWSMGETTQSIAVSATDTYCCVVTDANGCESDPCCFDFSVNPNPVCEITGDERVCEGESAVATASATGGTGPYTYLWSTGEETDSITVSEPGVYCLVVTDALGCESEPCCFDFSVNPNPVCEITGPDRVCEGDTGLLTVMGMAGTPPYTYLWSTGETTQSITVSVADTYCCVVTDANGCVSDPCCFDFSVNPNPTCEITGDDRVCEGDSGMLVVMGMGGTPPYTYLWSTGETTEMITVSVADTYCCTVTDANGCESDPCCFDFAVNPNPVCEINQPSPPPCETSGNTLTVMGMGGTSPYTFLWTLDTTGGWSIDGGENTDTVTYTTGPEGTSGTFMVTVTDANGCTSTDPCTLQLECVCVDIGDFVWLDENGDGCQDPDEPGIPDVTVNLYADCDMPMLVGTTMTDGSGAYNFRVCEPGEYLVEFVAPDGFEETMPNACDDGMGGNDDENDSDCIDGVVCVTVGPDDDFSIDCGLELVDCDIRVALEGCVIPPPPGPPGDACDGKVLELVLEYTAEDCSATVTAQPDDKWDCEDLGPLPDMVYIVVSKNSNCSDDIYFAGDVMPGEALVAPASAAGLNEYGSNTYVCIYDFDGGMLLQSLRFHTSCSQPLGPGDQYGSLLLVEMTTTNGGTVGLPGDGGGDDECITVFTVGGGDCDGKLLTLDLTYTGEGCEASNTTQDSGKWNCSGDPGLAQPVRILVTSENGDKVYADESGVMIGQTVLASAAYAGENDFENQTRVRVYNASGMLLQDVDFHTSCSQPLAPGDQFGSQLIAGLSSTEGGSSQVGVEVEYTYTVTNNGDSPVENVTVMDSVFGMVPGSPIPLLLPGEPVVLTLVVTITDTTVNTVTVVGNDDPECTAQATTEVTRLEPPADCCENGKPRGITMLYTGEDCSATSHSQDAGKVSCDDFGMLTDMVFILATNKEDPYDDNAKVWFSGPVEVGQAYDIDATNAGEGKLSSTTFVHIFQYVDISVLTVDSGGPLAPLPSVSTDVLLQSVEFHTSCSQPLFEGDQFGASLLLGCVGEDEPIPGDCCFNGKPRVLAMEYTAQDCMATSHAQDPGKVSCDDFGSLLDSVFILSTNKENPDDGGARVWFSGTVSVGEVFSIDATNAGKDKLEKKTFIHIFDSAGGSLLQSVEFHTSCSQPLFDGNQFGASLLVGCIGENEPIPGDCCTAGKPVALFMEHTGDDCSATSHQQDPGKVNCTDLGLLPDDAAVYILSTNRENPDDGGAKVWFEGLVYVGDIYTIDAANAGVDKLESKTFIHVFDGAGGTLLQTVEFHTSCSQPLNQGNQFGSARLVDCIGEEGPVPGDANNDFQVDVQDLLIVVTNWGACPGAPAPCEGDVDGNGMVNVTDLMEVMTNWDADE